MKKKQVFYTFKLKGETFQDVMSDTLKWKSKKKAFKQMKAFIKNEDWLPPIDGVVKITIERILK